MAHKLELLTGYFQFHSAKFLAINITASVTFVEQIDSSFLYLRKIASVRSIRVAPMSKT